MKKLSLYILLFTFSFPATAQECAEMFDYLKVGTTLEYSNFNKKGKLESINTQKVTQVGHSSDTLVATFAMTSTNEKGKEIFKNTFPMKCHAGTVFMDMSAMVPQQQNAQNSPDMQVAITSTDQVFPANMKVGQALPDAEMDMKMSMGGLQLMNTHYSMKNRKVEAQETVTTAAGTYKCLKISYDFEYKLLGTRTTHTEYWYSPSVGMVKSINYDKKGSEESRMELTKVVRGQ